MFNIAVLASGRGLNFASIVEKNRSRRITGART